jgi:DNA-binding XRE family transcriptional regulator
VSRPLGYGFRKWYKNRNYVAADDALQGEFAVAAAHISARRSRNDAGITQGQVAQAMGATQAVVARLENDRTMPSTRTLRFAKATHARRRISFEPVKAGHSVTRSSVALEKADPFPMARHFSLGPNADTRYQVH